MPQIAAGSSRQQQQQVAVSIKSGKYRSDAKVWIGPIKKLVSLHHMVYWLHMRKRQKEKMDLLEFLAWRKLCLKKNEDIHHINGPGDVGERVLGCVHMSINRGS